MPFIYTVIISIISMHSTWEKVHCEHSASCASMHLKVSSLNLIATIHLAGKCVLFTVAFSCSVSVCDPRKGLFCTLRTTISGSLKYMASFESSCITYSLGKESRTNGYIGWSNKMRRHVITNGIIQSTSHLIRRKDCSRLFLLSFWMCVFNALRMRTFE